MQNPIKKLFKNDDSVGLQLELKVFYWFMSLVGGKDV